MKSPMRSSVIVVLLVLPAMVFLVLRDKRMDQERTLGHPNPVIALAFVDNGRQLATVAGGVGSHSLWDVPTRTLIRRKWKQSSGHIRDFFFQQGEMFAHFTWDDKMEQWQVLSGRLLHTIDWNNKLSPNYDKFEDLCSATLSPDGKMLASAIWMPPNVRSSFVGNQLKLWDVSTGKLKRMMVEEAEAGTLSARPRSIAFSPDAKLLAEGLDNGIILLWDIPSGELRAKQKGHSSEVTVVFSPDGRFLASGSTTDFYGQRTESGLKLWDTQSGALVRTLESNGDSITALTFSPDNKKLASGYANGRGSIWDVATGKRLQNLISHRDSILSLAFSPDGKTLATGSKDRTVQLRTIP